MTHIEQAIRDAVEKGEWRSKIPVENMFAHNAVALAFLDPAFWQALGRARGWKVSGDAPSRDYYENYTWLGHWHRFIDHLADGKDAESFFALPADSR